MTYTIFGSIAEALVFIYIGVSVFSYYDKIDVDGYHGLKGDYLYPWSPSTIGYMTLIVIIGRCLAVWFVHFAFKMCSKKADIDCRELLFISWGGMIRGAIAFGLVLKIPNG